MSTIEKTVCDVDQKECSGRWPLYDNSHIKLIIGGALTPDGKTREIDFCDLPCFVEALNGRIENYINPEKLKKLPENGT